MVKNRFAESILCRDTSDKVFQLSPIVKCKVDKSVCDHGRWRSVHDFTLSFGCVLPIDGSQGKDEFDAQTKEARFLAAKLIQGEIFKDLIGEVVLLKGIAHKEEYESGLRLEALHNKIDEILDYMIGRDAR